MGKYKYVTFLDEVKFTVEDSSVVSEETILDYEKNWNIVFPTSYKEFVLKCGKYLSNCFLQTSYLIDEYPKMWKIITKELEYSNSPFRLQPNMFVFAESLEQGLFWYFLLNEGDNPPVYSYTECDAVPQKKFDSFVDCIKNLHWYKNEIWGAPGNVLD